MCCGPAGVLRTKWGGGVSETAASVPETVQRVLVNRSERGAGLPSRGGRHQNSARTCGGGTARIYFFIFCTFSFFVKIRKSESNEAKRAAANTQRGLGRTSATA